jgi:flagellar biosynthesis GTPase FlhF
MLVKKFEAPTLREALKDVKNELGPEAIILQTKSKKTGFGLLSGPSVEITAAVSEKQIKTKKSYDKSLSSQGLEALYNNPASKQAKIYQNHEKKVQAKNNSKAAYTAKATTEALTKSFEDLIAKSGSQAMNLSTLRPAVFGKSSDGTSSQNGAGNYSGFETSQGSPEDFGSYQSHSQTQSLAEEVDYSEFEKKFENEDSVQSSRIESFDNPQFQPREESHFTDSHEIQNIKNIVQELVMEKNFISDLNEFDRNSTVLHGHLMLQPLLEHLVQEKLKWLLILLLRQKTLQ